MRGSRASTPTTAITNASPTTPSAAARCAHGSPLPAAVDRRSWRAPSPHLRCIPAAFPAGTDTLNTQQDYSAQRAAGPTRRAACAATAVDTSPRLHPRPAGAAPAARRPTAAAEAIRTRKIVTELGCAYWWPPHKRGVGRRARARPLPLRGASTHCTRASARWTRCR